MNMIETKNLTKSYGDFTAVDKLNLHIPKGSIYGFLGPNGAGKSTTMKMFLGLIKPSKGSFTIDGKQYPQDKIAILQNTGSLIEAPAFYGNLTGKENLEIISKILGLSQSAVAEALEITGLTPYKNRLAKNYSLGMKQRLGIAIALLNSPQLLILDEPTNGLDPLGIEELRELIRSFPSNGITVILSSHILSEVQQIADHVGIIAGGVLGYEGELRAGEDLEQLFMDVIRRNDKEGY